MESKNSRSTQENIKLKLELDSLSSQVSFNVPKTSIMQKKMIVIAEGADGKKIVQSGNLRQLIDRLVDPTEFDLDFLKAFMMMHTMFMDSLNLLNAIIDEFDKCINGGTDNNSNSSSLR